MKCALPVVLVLVLLAVYPNDAYYYKPKLSLYRLNALYKKLYDQVQYLADRLLEVRTTQGCEVGFISENICDDDGTFNLTDCVLGDILAGGDNAFSTQIPVTFSTTFDRPPAVIAGLTGMNMLLAKNCNAAVESVTSDGFVLSINATGILPFELNLFWNACPAAADP